MGAEKTITVSGAEAVKGKWLRRTEMFSNTEL